MKVFKALFLSSLALLGLISSAVGAPVFEIKASILHVRQNATGNCTSWVNACDLSTALDLAAYGDFVWVAAGTYKPTSSTDRESSFQLKSGVMVYGGFPAAGGFLEDRDWELHITTLSGDIGIPDNSDDNSYHVVSAAGANGTAVLDGFVISAGNANGAEPHNDGGGMYSQSSSPDLRDLKFSGNAAADYGGGIYNDASSPTLTNVTFLENSAAFGGGMFNNNASSPDLVNVSFTNNNANLGGGMLNISSSSPLIADSIFSNNTASGAGGGMYNYDSSPILSGVIFSGNTTTGSGAGMFNFNASSPTLTGVTFAANVAGGSGGGMENSIGSDPTLTQTVFAENTAGSEGGGMYNDTSNPKLINVTFSENIAEYGGGMSNYDSSASLTNVTFSVNSADSGGGMYAYYGYPSLINVTFSGNTAVSDGGGMMNDTNTAVLTNVTFTGNSASYGGGIANFYSNTTLTNAIVWGNTSQVNSTGGTTTITYSDIQGGYTGTGNINVDPDLGVLVDNGGFTLTHALSAGSPAIDVGNPDGSPIVDQRGYTRPVDGDGNGSIISDMGSYEYNASPETFTLAVEISGSGTVSKNPDKPEYSFGEVVILTAIADPYWGFAYWIADPYLGFAYRSNVASGTQNPLALAIQADTTINAIFELTKFDIYLPIITK